MKKKLQIFVSSTFNDLKEERQAAVEAILSAGHIPAGMELFSSGDESQLEVIKRWISESDIYMLILGGRYGSIEQITQKSYTHLEYEYAVKQGIPVFAILITDDYIQRKVKEFGIKVIEMDNQNKYKLFKNQVLGKICRFFDDTKDVKLAIHETLIDFQHRYEFTGWISGRDIGTYNIDLIKGIEFIKKLLKLPNVDYELPELLTKDEDNELPKLLTKDEEVYYVNKLNQGEKEAKSILIERNLRLVVSVSKQFEECLDVEDLISVGVIGLINGVNTYDQKLGIEFSEYISKSIETDIKNYINK